MRQMNGRNTKREMISNTTAMQQRRENESHRGTEERTNHFYDVGGRWIIGGVPVLSTTPAIVRSRVRNGRTGTSPGNNEVRNRGCDENQMDSSSDMETDIEDVIAMNNWRDAVECDEEAGNEEENDDDDDDEHHLRGLPTVDGDDNIGSGGDDAGKAGFCAETMPVQHRNTHDGATQYDFHEARRQVIRRCHVGESASDLVETNRTEADRIVHDAFFDRNTDSLKERLARVKALQCQINVLQTKENENKSVSFARCKWSSDNASFDELKKYFSSIEDFPDVSLLDGILFYKFSGASHCIRFSARCNALFPGCGAAFIGPPGAVPPSTRESLNFFHLMNYVCGGIVRYDGQPTVTTKTPRKRCRSRPTLKWYTTRKDKPGRFDCRAIDSEGHPIALVPVESFQTWILRMMGRLQNVYLNR